MCALMLGLKWTTAAVQCNMHVQCGKYICYGTFGNKVKCMYAIVPGHIVGSSEFILYVYVLKYFFHMCF